MSSLLKSPLFWYNNPKSLGVCVRALRPLASLYAGATARRLKRSGYHAQIPVICVGNINAGGTGKTPTVAALAEYFVSQGRKPHIVSRGFGGALSGPVRVDFTVHQACDVGDEPLLLSGFAPTWVSKDRALGVKAAEHAGADLVILDDGFQNAAVHKDMSLIVVDAWRGFGNGCVIPAGPLREPVHIGLERADAVLSIGNDVAQKRFASIWGADVQNHMHFTANLAPLPTGMPWRGLRVVAFAGIGHPEKFFQTLKDLGAHLLHAEALSDHQVLSPRLIQRLKTMANKQGAQLVTTEKDVARLPASERHNILPLPVRLDVHELDEFTRFLMDKIQG